MLICDGTSLSFQRRMWQWDDLRDEPVKQLNRSSFHEKVFLPDSHTRKLLQRFAAGGQYIRGKSLKPLDKKEKEKLFKDVKEASSPLYDLFTEMECDPCSLKSYRKLLLSLASSSPVCSYIHATTEVQNLLSEIFKETDVRKNPFLVDKIHKFIPIIFDVLENKSITGSLKILLKEMWNIAIDPFVDSIQDQESQEEIINEEMAFFPSLPKIRNRGVFDQDKRNLRNNKKSETCSKTYRGHPSLLPGIFTIFCRHGVCYGFQVMQTNESPDVPFTIFRTRFKTAPKYIIYDNACKLHSYCISRDPQFFKDTEFYVDRLHWENHTSCSYGYNLSLYPQFNSVNSQLSEQSNAGLKRIKDQLSYMTANNFMRHCTFYLWKKNRDKLSIC